MQKVVSINLNGIAYQIDESGYDALVAYLETAQRQLRDNPDRDEILADLEQAYISSSPSSSRRRTHRRSARRRAASRSARRN
jgi:hypothetical protein